MRSRPAARQWPIVAVAVLAQTLALLDNTILNIALQTLGDPVRGLGASSADLEWAVDSYSLVFGAGSFAGGALADRYGPRRTMMAGLSLLAVASALAAFSANAVELIACRGFMGAGAALITPATLVVVTRQTAPANRARAIAIWASSGALAVAIGPVAGGVLLARFWWGSVFLLNLPVAALCLAGAGILVPESRYPGRRVLDLLGTVLSTLGLGFLVYGVISGGGQPGFPGPLPLASGMAGLLLLTVFVMVQPRGTGQHRGTFGIDMRIFSEPRFSGGSVALLLLFFGLAGQLFYAAFYLQGVRGLSAFAAGAVMATAAAGVGCGNQLAPVLSRRLTARWTAVTGILVSSVTFGSYVLFDARTPLVAVAMMLMVQGTATGLVVSPMTTEMMAALPPAYAGVGSAVSATARPVGSTLGVAVLGSVLASAYRGAILPALGHLPASTREQATASAQATRALARSLHRPGLLAAANHAYLHAMYVTAAWTAVLSAAGAVGVIRYFRPQKPLPERIEAPGPGTAASTRSG
ncbi:MAG: MFS transporter [Nocardiopsaceae bacterium]|nr:MFS transporter [Nocardiopsaceae bacterium]